MDNGTRKSVYDYLLNIEGIDEWHCTEKSVIYSIGGKRTIVPLSSIISKE